MTMKQLATDVPRMRWIRRLNEAGGWWCST